MEDFKLEDFQKNRETIEKLELTPENDSGQLCRIKTIRELLDNIL